MSLSMKLINILEDDNPNIWLGDKADTFIAKRSLKVFSRIYSNAGLSKLENFMNENTISNSEVKFRSRYM